jgi:hypothetical protein
MAARWIVIAGIVAVAATSALAREGTGGSQSLGSAAEAARSPQQLRRAVHDAMRREAMTQGADHDTALRQLIALYDALQVDSSLPPDEALRMRATVRSRLVRAGEAIERQLARDAKAAAKIKKLPTGEQGVLAQQRANRPPRPGRVGAQPSPPQTSPNSQGAQQLVELIQKTVAPSSWDRNGGLGTIMYFEPRQVLVIRQTGDVHDRVGQALQNLRGQ